MINTFIHTYENSDSLKEYIVTNVENTDSLLIQVFFNTNIEKKMHQILDLLNMLLPDAHIIGTTTDGAIHNDDEDTHKTVISFTTFEKSTLKHQLIPFEIDEEEKSAKIICDTIVSEKSKLLILFADGLLCNIGGLINAIHAEYPNLIVAGGLAGDNAEFKKTLVCDKHSILQQAVVALSIDSEVLKVYNDFTLAWQPVGGNMLITKCCKNIVYEINAQKAVNVYEQYLNKLTLPNYVAERQPTIGIDFPFIIINKDDFHIARAGLYVYDDGSIHFAGEFNEGDKLSFSFTNEEHIIKSGIELGQRIAKNPVQSIFVYSCMARRRFMGKDIHHDLKPLASIAPTSGFYTYGEIYSAPNSKELLNHTMTIVALSEEDEIYSYEIDKLYPKEAKDETFNALLHLLSSIQEQASNNKDKTVALNDSLQYNSTTRELFQEERLIELSKSESLCFESLFLNLESKYAVTAESIVLHVWGENSDKTIDSVRSLIKKLRKKLPAGVIKNVYGGMYKLDV